MKRATIAALLVCLFVDLWVLIENLRSGDFLFACVAVALAAAAAGLLAIEVRGVR